MGDIRFGRFYDRVAGAQDPREVLDRLSDEEAASALGAASRRQDPYLANVLATDVMNRMRRKDALLRHVADGILATDADGRITAANPAVETLLGWSEAGLAGRDLHHTLCYRAPDGAFLRRDECAFSRTLRDGEPRQGRAHLVRQDGSMLAVTYTAAAVAEEGEMRGAVLAFQDATSLVEKIARDEERAERYRRLVERGPAYMYVARVDDDGHTQWMCPHLEATLGFAPDAWTHDVELRGEHIHPDDRERVRKAWRDCVGTGRRFVAEYRVRTAEGRVVWLRDEAVATTTATGRPVQFLGVLLDVTPQKEAEHARERRREQLERLVFGLAQGVTAAATFVFEPDGRIAFANRAAERIFGRSSSDLARLAYEEWGRFVRAPGGGPFPDEERPFRRAMREGRPAQGIEVVIERPDGTRARVRADAIPVRDPETGEIAHVVGTFVEQPEA